MVEDALNDFRADTLLLVRLVHNDIPNGSPVGKVGQDTPESDQVIPIPRTQGKVRVTQHLLGILERAVFCPRSLVKEPQELRGFEFLFFGEGYGSLEGGRHLILEYAPGESQWPMAA